jgi:hypothetical protein
MTDGRISAGNVETPVTNGMKDAFQLLMKLSTPFAANRKKSPPMCK